MKKAFVSLFAILAGITLVSCGPRRPDSGSNSTPTSTQASTPDSTPEIESKHAITLTQVEGVTLTSDKTEAKKDETVTITISNIAVGKKVTLKATPEVEFTQGTDANTYTFVMPDNDVSITAEVISVESNVQSFNIYMRGVTSLPKGSFSVGGEARTIDRLYAGEKVTLSFSDLSSSDFPKDKDFYLYVGDEIISSKVVQGEDEKLSLTLYFTVPEDKTDLVLVPAAGTIDEKGVGIKIDTLPEGIKVYGVKDGDKYASGQGAYLFVKKEAGYKVSLQYKTGTSDFQNGNLDSSGFAMIPLEGETEVRFTTENVGFHKITYVGAEDIASIDGKTDFSLPETYTVGERFTVSNIVAKDGKYIESIVVTGADGAKLYESLSSPSAIYFEMPDQDVTVKFTIKDNGKITFTGWEEYLQEAPKVIDGYSLNDKEVTSAAKGKYLNVYIKPKANYKVGALAYGEGKTSTFNQDWSNAGYFSAGFSMPEGNVTLSLTNISTLYTVTIENSDTEGASISLNSTSGFAKGDTVNFNVVVPDKTYALKSLIATYGDKTETWTVDNKKFTLNGTGSSGSFTMVDGNVSIKPVFEKVQTVDVAVTADTGVTFSFRTSVSQATVGEAGTQKLLPNDQISISSVATPSTDSAKYVQIQVTDSNNKVTNYDPVYLSIGGDSINYNYSASFAVTGEDGATVKAIKFALVDRAAIKTTVKNDTKAKLKFTINGKEAADLSGLKQYDQLVISFDETTFEKGYAYSYTLKNEKGETVTTNGTDTYLLSTNSPLTLEVSQRKAYSTTVNFDPAGSDTSNVYWSLTIDGNYMSNLPKNIDDGSKVSISSISIYSKDFDQYSWTLEVKVGDKTYNTDKNKILSTPLTFTVDGDVVFNFTLS